MRTVASAQPVNQSQVILNPTHPQVVGSFGSAKSLALSTFQETRSVCDLIEIRLDLLADDAAIVEPAQWSHLAEIPTLFTARRGDEGGAGDLDPGRRTQMLDRVLEHADLIDVELASAREMADLLERVRARGIPWVASWHDFEGRPESFGRIPEMASQALDAGASCFKAAVRLHAPDDVTRLVENFTKIADIPLSLMGMGALAPVSRVMCAQYGSVLNYGYIGDAPTAPGQWSAELLKLAIQSSESAVH